jgi:methyl-accepting chemotaxis protein
MVAWTIGTTLYYALYKFNAESGIPYVFGLLLKQTVGLIAGMYTAILVNLCLIPAKRMLLIREIRGNENDFFSRVRDTLVVLFSTFYLSVTFSYMVYYFANRGLGTGFSDFYLPVFLVGIFFICASSGLMALSKHEYAIQINSIQEVVRDLAEESSDLEHRINIINFNELGDIAGRVNAILDNFVALLGDVRQTSMRIAESSKRVAATSQQNAAHSSEQAAGASEVVSTMEDVDALSKHVGKQIREVSERSLGVKESVSNGFVLIEKNLENMDTVKVSYGKTIDGIKNLGEHITGIWEIVKIINNIAGQIKIIAFNAALEASSAGEAGKNFEIVASEIRRLADSTVASTAEIKGRISEIDEASDKLVHSSEEDSGKIQEAWEMSKNISGLFASILEASEASVDSADKIADSVNKQIGAFEQILVTLRQISDSISEFARSIDENSETALSLEETVRVLNGIVERYEVKTKGPV